MEPLLAVYLNMAAIVRSLHSNYMIPIMFGQDAAVPVDTSAGRCRRRSNKHQQDERRVCSKNQ
jgi:hypothetical protein